MLEPRLALMVESVDAQIFGCLDTEGLDAESPDSCDDDSPRGAPLFMFSEQHHNLLLFVCFQTIVPLELLHSTSGCRIPKQHVRSTNLTTHEAISPFNENSLTAAREVGESFLAHCHRTGGFGTGRVDTSKAGGALGTAFLGDLWNSWV